MGESEQGRKIDWMYAGASAHVDREEYLLGRSIDSSLRQIQQDDDKKCHTRDETLVNVPGALFEEKQQAVELDQRAKMREDPLAAIKRQAEERKRELLSNPYRLKQVALKYGNTASSFPSSSSREQGKRDSRINRHKKPKHDGQSGTEKLLQALKSVGVNKLQSLLGDDNGTRSSSDDDSGERRHGREERNRRGHDDGRRAERRNKDHQRPASPPRYARHSGERKDARDSERSSTYSTSTDSYSKPSEGGSNRTSSSIRNESRTNGREYADRFTSLRPRSGPSRATNRNSSNKADDEASVEQKLAEMRKNAEWRAELNDSRLKDAEKRNLAQLERDAVKSKQGKGFIETTLTAAAGASSIEQRIRSNLNNVQRTTHALNQNFAKR